MNPQGQMGMNRRIMEFDPSKVHPEITARSKEILDQVELREIQAVSAGAGTFYVWVGDFPVNSCQCQLQCRLLATKHVS